MATNTYIPLDKKTIATSTTSVTFTGISQAYTDLVIVANYGSTLSEDYLQFRFNSDSSTNYSTNSMDGNGSTTRSGRSADRDALFVQWNVSAENAITTTSMINIQNYTSTSMCKSVLVRNNRATSTTPTYTGTELLVGLWRKTPEAITTITVKMSTGSILAGSTFSLYGISAVDTASAPKATGGAIYSDSTYYYHVFANSGSFVTNQSLTCDVVSVGGGGGGGWNNAGGGGGGEVDILSSLSIGSGVSKTVTVGAGGATATSTASAGGNGVTSSFSTDTSSLGGGGGGTGDASAGNRVGQTGGSGGGGSLSYAGGSASGSNTNAGGAGFAVGSGPERYAGGGGGGATTAGGDADTNSRVSGAGGQGKSLSSIFSGLDLGAITYLGSGGSGGIYVNGNTGTAGTPGTNAGAGGQQTSTGNVSPTAATANAGGGGGGGSYTGVNSRQGSNGGSGIVIVRYAKA